MRKIIIAIMLIVLCLGCARQPMNKEVISSPNAPKAIGPYSQAIRIGNMLYLAGQLGIDPATGKFAGDDFAAQAEQALKNQQAVLTQAGFSLTDVVQVQVFVTDLNNYPVFNEIYKTFFQKDYPARAVLEVSRIPADGLIEVMMLAVKAN